MPAGRQGRGEERAERSRNRPHHGQVIWLSGDERCHGIRCCSTPCKQIASLHFLVMQTSWRRFAHFAAKALRAPLTVTLAGAVTES